MKGKTPEATLSAALYSEAKKPDGAVILVERGMMKARPEKRSRGERREELPRERRSPE